MSSRIIYLRPSAAHAWGRCAGYARLNSIVQALPELAENEVREDGTATHWLAAECWSIRLAELHGLTTPPEPVEGSIAPNGRELTAALVAGAEEYLDVLVSWGYSDHTRVESGLPTASVFPGTQDGTPDAYQVLPWSSRGRLADLKMGFRPVEVWRNLQLVVYGWTLFCLYPHLVDMEFTIVQPRVAHRDGTVRSWIATRDEVRALAEQLQAAVRNAYADDPVCTVNTACRNCGAAHACDSLQAAGGVGIDVAYGSTPHVLTSEELAHELAQLERAAEHIGYRITGLTAQAQALIGSGQRVPGYKIGNADTRWRWREESRAEVEQLGELLGVDVYAPRKLKSVPQLRNAFPQLDVQAMYAEKPTGERRLLAVDPNEALRAFTQRK